MIVKYVELLLSIFLFLFDFLMCPQDNVSKCVF